ncbi:hypothetical protein BZL29_8562 [Mycobacterium kansasii]|uniref:Uncharacterized protein n=1 Tax=Mycobacterium kansasii TaxID=1768 RepID=A0A1V3WAM0_MYCKA|nr:hypothetical protein BZL29_8562 [Mycobacterium kansasii]
MMLPPEIIRCECIAARFRADARGCGGWSGLARSWRRGGVIFVGDSALACQAWQGRRQRRWRLPRRVCRLVERSFGQAANAAGQAQAVVSAFEAAKPR